MIPFRQLINEIPAKKFHSAVMTSFSINLYYCEVQLLRTLAGKGINFVSAIVDSDCLSNQLLKFSNAFERKRSLDFSIHGYKTKGAFHPKIQFYAGEKSVLVLVGSGNLTVMGHGKNLEVWSPFMVESVDSPAYPLVRDVWNYLKGIYNQLGTEADYIVRSIEENCAILQKQYDGDVIEHIVGENSVRLFTNKNTSLFDQCIDWIGDDKIKTITIMVPFYDDEAKLIKALNERFKPQEMNLVVEEGFGVLPNKKSIPDYITMYDWRSIKDSFGNMYQSYFHSKCFFFAGEMYNYMLCGSANASVAAFGIPGANPTNHETCVGFKSKSTNYLKLSEFELNDSINVDDIISTKEPKDNYNSEGTQSLWIKEASYCNDEYELSIENQSDEIDVNIAFFTGSRSDSFCFKEHLKWGSSMIKGIFNLPINPLYVEITNSKGVLISNRQFVIPTDILGVNNPSPESVYIRKRCREIESGNFVNGQMLKFFTDLFFVQNSKKPLNSISNESAEKPVSDEEGFSFDSLEEYLRDDSPEMPNVLRGRKGRESTRRSMMFFDSIVSYISKSFQEKKNEDIDEEETEDVSKSSGRDKSESQNRAVKKEKEANNIRDRILKMFDKYISNLEFSALSERDVKRSISLLEELKQFMAAIFFLYRTFSYRYTLTNDDETEHSLIKLLRLPTDRKTATEYFYRITSLFGLYVMKSAILDEDDKNDKRNITELLQYAFKLCLTVFSVCDCLNESNKDYEMLAPYKAVAIMNLRHSLCIDIDSITTDQVFELLDRDIQLMDEFDETAIKTYINNNIALLNNPDKIVKDDVFGYYFLKSFNKYVALPCTMAYQFNSVKREYCSDYRYFYKQQKMVKVYPYK
ncbi:MAG: hypothetical protein K6A41_04465 [Bacteroidales bacterium]|nr:hypothetical protein [Bacteroidales bacterium]